MKKRLYVGKLSVIFSYNIMSDYVDVRKNKVQEMGITNPKICKGRLKDV